MADIDKLVEVARTAAHIEGISDPYGARCMDYLAISKPGSDKYMALLREADEEAEANNHDAWRQVVEAILAEAEK